ncbi:MAG: hypothetical protein AABX11_01805 [Nanoarchaeota archaeon]
MFLEVAGITGNAIDLVNVTSGVVNASVGAAELLAKIGMWIKAIGIIAAGVVIFQIASFFVNLIKTKRLGELNDRLENVENKLDELMSRKKN